MKLDTLFDNYDFLMDSPDSTVKMRKLILQVAVQGKLVEQNSTDEPASELLKRIKAEKEKLIAEGKIKKQKPLPPIAEDEIPYGLPQGWEWIRLDDVSSYIQRGKGPRYVDNSDFPVVSQKCIQWNGFQIEKARFIDPASLEKYAEERFLQTGDLLWNSTGTGTIGRLCVYNHGDNPYDKVVSDSHVTVVRPLIINSEYLFCFLASPVIQTGFEDRASGTTNQIELATSTVKNQVIPIAPLMEQHRIVAKVDQLMHLCDQLDACQKKAATKYESLNDAALEKLLSSKTIDEFANHWQFLCNNFDLIYNDPAHVNKLRQAILQLAVQGKLAPQDLNDEPASELLKRIKAEKEKLIAEGKIKKQKPLPSITENEIPYELPLGWEWVYLPDITAFENNAIKRGPFGSAIRKEYFVPDGYKVYEQRNAIYDDFTLGKYFINEKKFQEMKSFQVKPKDIIISCSGTIGKVAIAPENIKQGIINQALLKITLNEEAILNKYFKILFENFVMRSNILQDLKGTAMKNIASIKILKTLPLPIPTKDEQKRIVSKVDQLMHLCDELETRLNQSKKDSEMLMQAVLYEAFS